MGGFARRSDLLNDPRGRFREGERGMLVDCGFELIFVAV